MKATKNKTYDQFGNRSGKITGMLPPRHPEANPTSAEITLATLAVQILPAIVGASKASPPWFESDAGQHLRQAVKLARITLNCASQALYNLPTDREDLVSFPVQTPVKGTPAAKRKDLLKFVVGQHTGAKDQTSQEPHFKRFIQWKLARENRGETIYLTDERIPELITSYIDGENLNKQSWDALAREFQAWWPVSKSSVQRRAPQAKRRPK